MTAGLFDERARCIAHLRNGHQCGQDASGLECLPFDIILCNEHRKRLIDHVRQIDRDAAIELEARWALAAEHRDRIGKVKPSFKKLDNGRWSFRLTLPNFNGGRGYEIRRAGFSRKLDAQRAGKQIIDRATQSVASNLEHYDALIGEMRAQNINRQGERARIVEELKAQGIEDSSVAELERTVYYVRRPDGAIKIGTTWNIDSRMRTFRNVSPVDLLATEMGGQPREAEMHGRFADCRLDGEWFQPTPALLRHIDLLNGAVVAALAIDYKD